METKSLKLTFCAGILLSLSTGAAATSFLFDDGTNQGWTVEIFDIAGATTTSVFSGPAGWSDINNYPNAPRTDAVGDSRGAANAAGGAVAAGADFRLVQFKSPDLSADPMWQNLSSYSGQVLASFTNASDDYFSNTVLEITDTTGGGSSARFFANENPAGSLPVDSWNQELLSGIDTTFAGLGITSYLTKHVSFNIWHSGILDVETVFSLDNVVPVAATDGRVPAPATIWLIVLGLVGTFLRTRKLD